MLEVSNCSFWCSHRKFTRNPIKGLKMATETSPRDHRRLLDAFSDRESSREKLSSSMSLHTCTETWRPSTSTGEYSIPSDCSKRNLRRTCARRRPADFKPSPSLVVWYTAKMRFRLSRQTRASRPTIETFGVDEETGHVQPYVIVTENTMALKAELFY